MPLYTLHSYVLIELFNIVMKLSKEGGDIVRVWLGPKCFVILNSVEDLQIVANSADCLEKSKVYRLIPVRNGLVTAKGNKIYF